MDGDPRIILSVVRRYEAPPERVFDAWLDPGHACKWLYATPAGEMVRFEIAPRVGGRYAIVERRGGEDAEHFGEYLEIDRPRRLVFTLSVEKIAPDADRVIVEVAPRGAGCDVTLTHELQPRWAELVDRIQEGWTGILDGLAANLETR